MRALLGLALAACTQLGSQAIFPETQFPDAGPDATPLAPTLESLRENIFTPLCGRLCHTTVDPAGKMDLLDDPYAATVNAPAMGSQCGSTDWIRIVPGDVASSLLYQKVWSKTNKQKSPCGDPMPQGDPRVRHALSDAQVKAIGDWIAAGAPPD
jgi:hypothetical protein